MGKTATAIRVAKKMETEFDVRSVVIQYHKFKEKFKQEHLVSTAEMKVLSQIGFGDPDTVYIMDRGPMSQIVYGKVFKRDLPQTTAFNLDYWAARRNGILLVLLLAKQEDLITRLKQRQKPEPFPLQKLKEIQMEYLVQYKKLGLPTKVKLNTSKRSLDEVVELIVKRASAIDAEDADSEEQTEESLEE